MSTWIIEEQFEKSWKFEIYDTETDTGVARVGYYDTDRAEDHAHARLIAAAPDLLKALKSLLADIESLMGESDGVAGLHLNGDVASWSELDEGGQFERLSSLSAARAAIAKAEGR